MIGPTLVHVGSSLLDQPNGYDQAAEGLLQHLGEGSTWAVVATPAALHEALEGLLADPSQARFQETLQTAFELTPGLEAEVADRFAQGLQLSLGAGRRAVTSWGSRFSTFAIAVRLAEAGVELPFVAPGKGSSPAPPHWGALVPEADLRGGASGTVELATRLGSSEVHYWGTAATGAFVQAGQQGLTRVPAQDYLALAGDDGPLPTQAVQAAIEHGVELVLLEPFGQAQTRLLPGTTMLLRTPWQGAAAAA